MPSRDLKHAMTLIIDTPDAGEAPRRPGGLSLARALAFVVAVGLSFGLGACVVVDPEQPGGGGVGGKADGWGDGVPVACPGPAEVCDDHTDNDRDGYIDCRDLDCVYTETCRFSPYSAGGYEQDCANGLDDDGDGSFDCNDGDCLFNCVCASDYEDRLANRCGTDQDCAIGQACVNEECVAIQACEYAADCASCLALAGCGWCATTATCMTGGYEGPDSQECDWSEWDYYDC